MRGANGYFASHNGESGESAIGAGILNAGRLTLINCTIQNNIVVGGGGGIAYFNGGNGGPGGGAFGAGIYNRNTLTLRNCTVSGNTALGGTGGRGVATGVEGGVGGDARGAGIFNEGGINPATCHLLNCTLSENIAYGGLGALGSNPGDGGSAYGGNFYAPNNSVVRNTIFTAGGVNGGHRGVGGENNASDGLSGSADVFGELSSGGYNFISNAEGSSGWLTTDVRGVAVSPLDPLLGPLQDNGGPAFTRLPQSGSPVIDSGDDGLASIIATDQRGVPRKCGGHVDIGAVEVCAPELRIARGPGQTIVVSWSAVFRTLTLQSNSRLSDNGWQTVQNPIANDGVSMSLTIGAQSGTKFFRLATTP